MKKSVFAIAAAATLVSALGSAAVARPAGGGAPTATDPSNQPGTGEAQVTVTQRTEVCKFALGNTPTFSSSGSTITSVGGTKPSFDVEVLLDDQRGAGGLLQNDAASHEAWAFIVPLNSDGTSLNYTIGAKFPIFDTTMGGTVLTEATVSVENIVEGMTKDGNATHGLTDATYVDGMYMNGFAEDESQYGGTYQADLVFTADDALRSNVTAIAGYGYGCAIW